MLLDAFVLVSPFFKKAPLTCTSIFVRPDGERARSVPIEKDTRVRRSRSPAAFPNSGPPSTTLFAHSSVPYPIPSFPLPSCPTTCPGKGFVNVILSRLLPCENFRPFFEHTVCFLILVEPCPNVGVRRCFRFLSPSPLPRFLRAPPTEPDKKTRPPLAFSVGKTLRASFSSRLDTIGQLIHEAPDNLQMTSSCIHNNNHHTVSPGAQYRSPLALIFWLRRYRGRGDRSRKADRRDFAGRSLPQ